MGLDVYLKKGESHIEEDSRQHPTHMFKVGYFRSSYNGSGFNSVMGALGVPTLYNVFLPPEDGGRFTPDWSACLLRANAAREAYKQMVASPGGRGRVTFISAEKGEGADSDAKALSVFRDEASKPHPFPGYSNKRGHFWWDGLTIKAAIPGTQKWLGAGVFLIYEAEVGSDDEGDWYEQALDIVIETCEWVIATGTPEGYALHWSA